MQLKISIRTSTRIAIRALVPHPIGILLYFLSMAFYHDSVFAAAKIRRMEHLLDNHTKRPQFIIRDKTELPYPTLQALSLYPHQLDCGTSDSSKQHYTQRVLSLSSQSHLEVRAPVDEFMSDIREELKACHFPPTW